MDGSTPSIAIAVTRCPLRLTVSAAVAVPPDTFLSWFVPRDPVGLFNAWGPIPGVASARGRDLPWSMAGAQRLLVLTDGTLVTEQVIEHRLPQLFRYRMTGFAGVMTQLVFAVEGEWRCEAMASGSHVSWCYSFVHRGVLARGMLWTMSPLWRGYMRSGLRAVCKAAEHEVGGLLRAH